MGIIAVTGAMMNCQKKAFCKTVAPRFGNEKEIEYEIKRLIVPIIIHAPIYSDVLGLFGSNGFIDSIVFPWH